MRHTFATLLLAGLLVAGCSSQGRGTKEPAPAPAASAPSESDSAQHIVRHWREEKTADGRTIRVPEYYLVDEHGRIIRRLNDKGK